MIKVPVPSGCANSCQILRHSKSSIVLRYWLMNCQTGGRESSEILSNTGDLVCNKGGGKSLGQKWTSFSWGITG